MKFSILIPVYNVENYISECLDSILSQTLNDYEIICVNDGSTDNSGKICEDYRLRFPDKIKVIHKKNQGLISARRLGIKNAEGDYVCFLDSDDFIVRNYLDILYKEIILNKPDIIIFGYERVDEYGNTLCKVQPSLPVGLYSGTQIKEIKDRVVFTSELNNLCFKCVKTDILDKEVDYAKLFYVSSGEDLIQSLPLLDKAKSISIINHCLYLYRTNPNGMTNSRLSIQNINSWLAMYSVLCEYAERWDYFESLYRQRFGLILNSILLRLITNRFASDVYKREDYILLVERLFKKDFQDELKLYKPLKMLSKERIFRCLLLFKQRSLILSFITILGGIYSILKHYKSMSYGHHRAIS